MLEDGKWPPSRLVTTTLEYYEIEGDCVHKYMKATFNKGTPLCLL